jgi:hypothetical protein
MRKLISATLVAAVMFGAAYWLTANIDPDCRTQFCMPGAAVIWISIELRSLQYPSLLRFVDPPDGTAPIFVTAMDVTSRLSLPRLSSFLREARKIASTLLHVKQTEEFPWN